MKTKYILCDEIREVDDKRQETRVYLMKNFARCEVVGSTVTHWEPITDVIALLLNEKVH